MIKKIRGLTKVFIKEYFENLYIFNKNPKKTSKKSIFMWITIINIIVISFFSYKIIDWLNIRGKAILFLQIYFPIIATIFLLQIALICSNIFFFSKDLELILPLPIKPTELLIAKFNNILSIMYAMEILFLAPPLLIYGLIVARNLVYFFMMIFVMLLFPVFFVTIISTIMLFIIQLSVFIKNKDIFQIIIALLMSVIIIFMVINIVQPLVINNVQINEEILKSKINNYFIVINPSIELLSNFKALNIFVKSFELIFICAISFLGFVFIGKGLYLKNILKNMTYINKKKNNKKIKEKRYKKTTIKISYIKNEFKKLIKNPTFFIQCIFQYFLTASTIILLINLFIPTILLSFQQQDVINEIGINDFALQSICIVLGILQIIFTLSNISLTAISREGKNANVMKYIPVDLYKQFLWKNVPQIILNILVIFAIGFTIYSNITGIPIFYYIFGGLNAMILNVINSFAMLTIDLKNPNLDWTTESSAINDRIKKLYQYVFTIIIIIVLSYITKILKGINIINSLIFITSIELITLITINLYIKKNINKLFKKIN